MTLPDWSLSVGIGTYPRLSPQLPGAVADARRFHRWAVSQGVEHAELVVSPDDDDVDAFSATPTEMEIAQFFLKVLETARANNAPSRGLGLRAGRRLYVYFAGHGVHLSADGESVVLTARAQEAFGDHIAARLYAEWAAASRVFEEVLFFADTCAQVMSGISLRKPALEQLNVSEDTPRAYFQAALAYDSAWEHAQPDGSPGGQFTWALLRGLEGGAADEHGRVTARGLEEVLVKELDRTPGVKLLPNGVDGNLVICEVPRPDDVPVEPETPLANLALESMPTALPLGSPASGRGRWPRPLMRLAGDPSAGPRHVHGVRFARDDDGGVRAVADDLGALLDDLPEVAVEHVSEWSGEVVSRLNRKGTHTVHRPASHVLGGPEVPIVLGPESTSFEDLEVRGAAEAPRRFVARGRRPDGRAVVSAPFDPLDAAATDRALSWMVERLSATLPPLVVLSDPLAQVRITGPDGDVVEGWGRVTWEKPRRGVHRLDVFAGGVRATRHVVHHLGVRDAAEHRLEADLGVTELPVARGGTLRIVGRGTPASRPLEGWGVLGIGGGLWRVLDGVEADEAGEFSWEGPLPDGVGALVTTCVPPQEDIDRTGQASAPDGVVLAVHAARDEGVTLFVDLRERSANAALADARVQLGAPSSDGRTREILRRMVRGDMAPPEPAILWDAVIEIEHDPMGLLLMAVLLWRSGDSSLFELATNFGWKHLQDDDPDLRALLGIALAPGQTPRLADAWMAELDRVAGAMDPEDELSRLLDLTPGDRAVSAASGRRAEVRPWLVWQGGASDHTPWMRRLADIVWPGWNDPVVRGLEVPAPPEPPPMAKVVHALEAAPEVVWKGVYKRPPVRFLVGHEEVVFLGGSNDQLAAALVVAFQLRGRRRWSNLAVYGLVDNDLAALNSDGRRPETLRRARDAAEVLLVSLLPHLAERWCVARWPSAPSGRDTWVADPQATGKRFVFGSLWDPGRDRAWVHLSGVADGQDVRTAGFDNVARMDGHPEATVVDGERLSRWEAVVAEVRAAAEAVAVGSASVPGLDGGRTAEEDGDGWIQGE